MYFFIREKNITDNQPGGEQVKKTVTPANYSNDTLPPTQDPVGEQGRAENTPAVSASSVAAMSEREKAALIGIDFAYGKAMLGLGLNEGEVQKLRALLLARAAAGGIAKDVVLEQGIQHPRELPEMVSFARSEAEDEIRKIFGEEKYAKISTMLQSTTHLLNLKMNYEPALASAGVSDADPRQTLELASIMLQEYGSDNSKFSSRAEKMNTTTGLTPFDDNVLARASEFLTPPQLSVLSQIFSNRNRKISKTPNH